MFPRAGARASARSPFIHRCGFTMANVTFTSPIHKDVTVYAVAGDTQTLLSVAQAHKVPLEFDCQNGECGSCMVQITVLSNKTPYGVALTEKEKTVLRFAGKITKEQLVCCTNTVAIPILMPLLRTTSSHAPVIS